MKNTKKVLIKNLGFRVTVAPKTLIWAYVQTNFYSQGSYVFSFSALTLQHTILFLTLSYITTHLLQIISSSSRTLFSVHPTLILTHGHSLLHSLTLYNTHHRLSLILILLTAHTHSLSRCCTHFSCTPTLKKQKKNRTSPVARPQELNMPPRR